MNLTPDQQKIAALQGQLHAMRTCITALLASMPPELQPVFVSKWEHLAEWTTANVLGSAVPEEVSQAFAAELKTIRALFADR